MLSGSYLLSSRQNGASTISTLDKSFEYHDLFHHNSSACLLYDYLWFPISMYLLLMCSLINRNSTRLIRHSSRAIRSDLPGATFTRQISRFRDAKLAKFFAESSAKFRILQRTRNGRNRRRRSRSPSQGERPLDRRFLRYEESLLIRGKNEFRINRMKLRS